MLVVITYLRENITGVCSPSQGQPAERKGKEEPMWFYQ